MAKIWRNRIEAGDQLFENCPTRYINQVLTLMRQDVVDQIITKEQFEQIRNERRYILSFEAKKLISERKF